MICSCHNWQNKRKATDVRWRRKICDQVTALHTGIIDHLFLIFSFQICIAPPVLTKIWYIFCQITEIHTPCLWILKLHVLVFLTNQKNDCVFFLSIWFKKSRKQSLWYSRKLSKYFIKIWVTLQHDGIAESYYDTFSLSVPRFHKCAKIGCMNAPSEHQNNLDLLFIGLGCTGCLIVKWEILNGSEG